MSGDIQVEEMPAEVLKAAIAEQEADLILNFRAGYHKRIRIITGKSTINIEIRNGKLGKVTQTEVIRT